MSYSLITPAPAARAPDLADAAIGPGLYPGEVAVRLDDGTMVAVIVTPARAMNGAGGAMAGRARWIAVDGCTQLDGDGLPVTAAATASADAGFIQAHGLGVMARELLMLLLGEPVDQPAFAWSDEMRAHANIRHAIAFAQQAITVDPAALLALTN